MFPRREVMLTCRRAKVLEDWVRVLPSNKNQLFETVVRRWERGYAMMSVTLDDALSLRAQGELACARQQVSIASDLLGQLGAALTSLCGTLLVRGRMVSELPAVEPLKANFFRGDRAQSAASWNGILHRLSFRGRSRFFHKLRILSDTLQDLELEFQETAGDISKGLDTRPGDSWETLDFIHYDFSTCLRETEVLLKSFLRSLPEEQLPALARDLDAAPAAPRLPVKAHLLGAPA